MVASLIALTALLGAIAAWRAESAALSGEASERVGFAQGVADAQARSSVNSGLRDTLFNYERARQHLAEARALRQQATLAKTRAPADAGRLGVQASAEQSLGEYAMSRVDVDALLPNGTLSLGRKYRLDYAVATSAADLDPSDEFARADRMSTKSERLVGLTALLIAAAFFFTLAQVSRTWVKRYYLVGGLLVLASAAALLGVVEFAT